MSNGLNHIAKLLQLLHKRSPGFPKCSAELNHSGVLELRFPLRDAEGLLLRVSPRSEGKAWKRTASFDLSIAGSWPNGLPKNGQTLLSRFAELLERSDNGTLSLPTPPQSGHSSTPQPTPWSETQRLEIQAQRAAYAAELHWSSFIGYKSLMTEDLYPHTTPLGDVVSTATILEDWKHSLPFITNGGGPDRLGLYVHIPFCTVACSFCACAKTDNFKRRKFDRYLENLREEIALFRPLFKGLQFTSVYFGGGTPSLLPAPYMRKLFTELYSAFEVPPGTQVIFEGNPDSLNDSKIEVLATVGRVTRLTIGVQTLDDAVQKRIKRHNKPHYVSDALESARKWGINHVNVDLMAGLPEQTMESFMTDLAFLNSLEPDTIHINAFRPFPHIELSAQGYQFTPERVALRDAMEDAADSWLEKHGHRSFGHQRRRKTASASNVQLYDLRKQNSSLLGLGFPALAHAFGRSYYTTHSRGDFDRQLELHLRQRQWLRVPAGKKEEIHKYLVTNFRTGFERSDFKEIFGVDVMHVAETPINKLVGLGYLELTDSHIVSRIANNIEHMAVRGLLYSPDLTERILQKWGDSYDPDADYIGQIEQLVES